MTVYPCFFLTFWLLQMPRTTFAESAFYDICPSRQSSLPWCSFPCPHLSSLQKGILLRLVLGDNHHYLKYQHTSIVHTDRPNHECPSSYCFLDFSHITTCNNHYSKNALCKHVPDRLHLNKKCISASSVLVLVVICGRSSGESCTTL